jgi:hypothetical protein
VLSAGSEPREPIHWWSTAPGRWNCRTDSVVCSLDMLSPSQRIGACSLAILTALYVVGAVSIPPGSLRHEVQTLPLWFPIVLGFQKRDITKWMAVPLLIFWLAIMTFIWLFLLGWARLVTGHFFPTEIAMTLVIGVACVTGLIASLRLRTSTPPHAAVSITLLLALLQLLAFRISLIPYISRR